MQQLSHKQNAVPMPPLALLVGGLASRLGSLATRVPKSLMQVAGEPFIAHQLRMLASQGVTNVVLCCGHLGSMIEDFVGDGSQFGCRVRYSHDGTILLGTGGAICKALPMLGERFWVMYGDSYLTLDFQATLAAFNTADKLGLMTVFRNNNRWDSSNVEFADGHVIRYNKNAHSTCAHTAQYIDYGLSLYRAEAFQEWPEGTVFDLSVLQAELVARKQMAGFEVYDRFYEIGSNSGLRETDALLRSKLEDSSIVGATA